ncbi:metallopeptidase [Candidatus Microgenomates bacterium]|nr:metallopeptidase [Candidatus Microgenomates bacterium]
MDWVEDKQIEKRLQRILKSPFFSYINIKNITIFRSFGSSSRAYARIWGFPRIWQMALNHKPHYIIEVISEHFDRQSYEDQTRTLIHELLHIPKKFSGALVPHRGRGHNNIDRRIVEQIYQQYKINS